MFTLGLPKQPTFYSTENYLGWVSFGIGTTSFTIDTYHKPKMGTSHRYIIWRFPVPFFIPHFTIPLPDYSVVQVISHVGASL